MVIRSLFLGLLIFSLVGTQVYADPLVLSDAEMKKLQQYFPSQDASDATNHLVWKGNPLTIELLLNQEKRIIFPGKVLPDLKAQLTTDQLRIYNDDKSLYLTALKSFPSTRLFVTDESSGEVVLIDISTNDKASAANTFIDIPRVQNHAAITANANNDSSTSSVIDNGTSTSASDDDETITLLRFAWQQLFAPERLLNNPLGISRSSMHTSFMLSTLIYGDKVYAHPDASWVYNNTYITAVELRNKYPHPTVISLNRDLCGDWQAASLYPRSHLKPAGDKSGDSTVLFLVSKRPFSESMEVCNVHA